MTEAELQAEVIRIARTHKVLVFHSADSRRDTGAGFPDLVLVGKHRVLFCELKDGGAERSTAQTQWYYRLIAVGAHYVLWRPRDLDNGAVETLLREL